MSESHKGHSHGELFTGGFDGVSKAKVIARIQIPVTKIKSDAGSHRTEIIFEARAASTHCFVVYFLIDDIGNCGTGKKSQRK